jgi:elongation factor Ts
MSLELIKSIRQRTNLSFGEIKKAIDAVGATSSEDDIIAHLRKQGVLKAQAREGRETNEGGIFTYNHGGTMAVMVEINCETDFSAKSDKFKKMGEEVALHIAASNPKFVSEAEMSADFIEKELAIAKEQMINEGKPETIIEKILTGKRNSIVGESCLLSQPFLLDTSMTVGEYVTGIGHATGENVKIKRFVIFNLKA